MMRWQTTYLLIVCMVVQSSALDVECSFGFTGVSCRESNTTQKILIGVGAVLAAGVVIAILTCCCCGCCACCRSEPRHSTVMSTSATTVVPINYAQPIQTYPVCQGYQPVPVHPFPAQPPMGPAPCSQSYAMEPQCHGQPPSYQEAASAEQPLYPAAGHSSYHPAVKCLR
ncbi:protein shisa-5-like [Hypanus sabinus]|uniref:protein shisa-5-like n=1 Tax=Hypanus sabinus TaxID=79690 RepID=UPI0028C4E292|nr:protein shisa-5-like [Hypanus sabinus]